MLHRELCLIITPQEEDSLNTSKEVSKKDHHSISCKKTSSFPCRLLHQQYWIFPKINPGVTELDQEKHWRNNELNGHCAIHSANPRSQHRVNPYGEVMHVLPFTVSLFSDFKALEIQQHCCKVLWNNKSYPASHTPDFL